MSKTKKPTKSEIALWRSEGTKAWEVGQQPRDNPWTHDSRAAFWWLRGWTQAAIDAVKSDQEMGRDWAWPA